MKIVRLYLANPAHRLPMADRGGRLFDPVKGETVDVESPLWLSLLADKSLSTTPPVVAVAEPAEISVADVGTLSVAVPPAVENRAVAAPAGGDGAPEAGASSKRRR